MNGLLTQKTWLGMGVLFSVLALPDVAPAQNAVTQWDAIAVSTALASKVAPASTTAGGTSIYLAYVHLAIYNAVNAINPRYEPYGPGLPAPAGASEDAAAFAAAYYTLVDYFPDQIGNLSAQYAAALAGVPSALAKDEGIQVGQAAAAQIISMRANDGRGANVPYSYPSGPVPGVWIPTPPGLFPPQTPWVGQMKPLTMSSSGQFLPDEPPPDLSSQQWADDYEQVKTLGAINSTVRTPEQTNIGLFWTDHTSNQYSRALRGLAGDTHLGVLETARLFAMAWTAFADAFIGCMNAKYYFSFWRPVTAIRHGDIDGNSSTIEDPNWTPLGTTPNHPEYPAAHGCVTGSLAETLKGFFGTPHVAFKVDSNVVAGVRTFATVQDLEREVEYARIYAGFHYHHSLVQGFVLGHHVVDQMLVNYFRPLGPGRP